MLVIDGKEIFTTPEELVDPKHAALLLIDIQNDYVMPGGYFDKLGTEWILDVAGLAITAMIFLQGVLRKKALRRIAV